MVFLIIAGFGIGLSITAFARLMSFGLKLAERRFASMQSAGKRFLAWVAFLAVLAAASIPTVLVLLQNMPDFRTTGDGGVGMAFNAVARVAVSLLIPAVLACVMGFAVAGFRNSRNTPPKPSA